MSSFVAALNNDMNAYDVNPKEKIFESIWKEYESVILQSLVTSFGLDFIVHDQHGGDVDTVHNVRQISIDPEMKYKNYNNSVKYCQTFEKTPNRFRLKHYINNKIKK